MNQSEFLKKYNISKKDFEVTGLEWKKLEEISTHYISNRHIYEPAAKDIVERLVTLKTVHSVRYRIKDAEHLIEKIIRKKLEDPSREYSLENYSEKIDDIIGVRALHLYKSDWEEIGDFIEKTWSLKEKPTANIRKGDSEEIQKKILGTAPKFKNTARR